MASLCPRCGAEYDATESASGRRVACACGQLARELRHRADAITWTILYSDLPRVDVEIAIQELRDWVDENLPDRGPLFEMVYEARWARFRAQGWERERPEV